jgi:hypothetical protein
MLEYLTFRSGLGVLIVAFAAYALPGVPVFRRHRLDRDAALAGNGAAAEANHRDRGAAPTAPAPWRPRLSLAIRGTRGQPIGVCDE